MTKYRKPSDDNSRAGPQTSLNISSSGVDVLWPVGPNDKREDFRSGQA